MLYPLKFKPIYKEKIWGGKSIAGIFNRDVPCDRVGESWELCSHRNGTSMVVNGILAGESLQTIIERYERDLLGAKELLPGRKFPLLLKIIDASDNLSLQVHPDDAYAYQQEQEPGKTEAWYIVSARENARIIYGLKESVTRNEFLNALQQNHFENVLRTVPVKKGDMVFVPAGTVHALLEGVVVYEVQQNSDTTYRVYDYGRLGPDGRPRELHTDKAVEVIRFGRQETIDFSRSKIECPYFQMEKITVPEEWRDATNNQYAIYCILNGKGIIDSVQGEERVEKGETILIPASLGNTRLRGNLDLLRIS
ncbi:mannose-6-phosphate isomerase type i [Lucifera butyrica]|uniref:Phosphohexomutase n=1 Tax=Lucifera butyrica TaxID=1351585 RepID=A0A498R6U6_9FIRM|nr:type I phosphomannose isomerase catalytic subunit [Lucifera butyrica]VBB05992.1 mannose-6-phosphate isomerase type i [Lucifera butyrica]